MTKQSRLHLVLLERLLRSARNDTPTCLRWQGICLLLCILHFTFCTALAADFRVCADPNNLPFSNQKLEGFENKIAEVMAQAMESRVTYTWWPQRRGFIRNTLSAGQCDVVMGVPSDYDPVLTTQPYYRSTYVFVYPKTSEHQVTSLDDPALRHLRIGVHLVGDDYANSPPAHALSARGVVDKVVGYSIFGDYAEESPPGKIIQAVANKDIDMAIVWGPIAGYFAKRQSIPLTLVPVPADADSPRLPFAYSISMGVRKGNKDLRATLNEILTKKASEIGKILEEYGVPLISEQPSTVSGQIKKE